MSKKKHENYYKPYLSDEDIEKLVGCGEYFELQVEKGPIGYRGKNAIESVLTDMLIWAIQHDNWAAFEVLTSISMREKHKTLLTPSENNSPLHLAVELGRKNMVFDMVVFGADPNLEYDGKTAFDLAKGKPEILKMLSQDEEVVLENESSSVSEDSGYYPMQKAVAAIFGKQAKDFMGKISFLDNDAKARVELVGNLRWTAFGSNKVNSSDFKAGLVHDVIVYMNSKLGDAEDQELLDVNQLPDEAKQRFKTLLAYASSLYKEHKDISNSDESKEILKPKVDAISTFIKTILTTDPLTEEAIDDALNKFERDDVNRGTGFYRIHAFFKNKRFHDAEGQSRLVKSTLGELAYDLAESLKDDLKESKVLDL